MLKRFSINCYGHQLSLEEIRAQKSEKYIALKDKKGTREYEEHFLRYRPGDDVKTKKREKTYKIKTVRRKTRGKKTKKRGRGGLFY